MSKESRLYCVWIHHIKLCLYPLFILSNISIHSCNFWISQWCECKVFLLKASFSKWKSTKLFWACLPLKLRGISATECVRQPVLCHTVCGCFLCHVLWRYVVVVVFWSEEAGRGFLCQYTPRERISGGDVTSSEVWTALFVPVWASLGRNYFR